VIILYFVPVGVSLLAPPVNMPRAGKKIVFLGVQLGDKNFQLTNGVFLS
jgi:hypothetical protein